jgi:serine/threonine protein kinase
MALAPGARLGPYEILSLVGAGGMGEVYRATDTRLDREVAIKVSAARFSERFEKEARLIASLNHPNICQLHDVGPDYLVMEFVEGASLGGPLPPKEAAEYAGQILDALDVAHGKGITHRDLKPANISLEASLPRELFALPAGLVGQSVYEAAPDGQQFLVGGVAASPEPLTVIVNWPAMLKKGAAGQ